MTSHVLLLALLHRAWKWTAAPVLRLAVLFPPGRSPISQRLFPQIGLGWTLTTASSALLDSAAASRRNCTCIYYVPCEIAHQSKSLIRYLPWQQSYHRCCIRCARVLPFKSM